MISISVEPMPSYGQVTRCHSSDKKEDVHETNNTTLERGAAANGARPEADRLPWIDERNRHKLIDALQAGQFPTNAGSFNEGMSGQRWRVPSSRDPKTHYGVEQIYYWDGHYETRCPCPWGQEHGPFTSAGHPRPCRHTLIVWFYALPPYVRFRLLQQDVGLRVAWRRGLAVCPPDQRDPRWSAQPEGAVHAPALPSAVGAQRTQVLVSDRLVMLKQR